MSQRSHLRRIDGSELRIRLQLGRREARVRLEGRASVADVDALGHALTLAEACQARRLVVDARRLREPSALALGLVNAARRASHYYGGETRVLGDAASLPSRR